MANTQNFYYGVQTHFFALDTDITAGLSSPAFTRNFRVLDSTVFVTNAVPGATLTINRVRGVTTTAVAQFDVSGLGRAPVIVDLNQAAVLFESADVMQLISTGAALDANVIVYLQQFSV
jgi:phospholipase/lecithinase/hemolysin